MKKEILKGLDSELRKKAGVQKGTKRGSYKKNKATIEDPIVKTPIVETPIVETPIIETPVIENPIIENPIENTHSEFIKTIEVDNNIDSGKKSLDDFINANKSIGEYKQTETTQTRITDNETPISSEMKKLINGRMLLNMCNVVFPTLIKKIGGMFNDAIKAVDKQKLKLDKPQMDDMRECADEVAGYIFSQVNPITAFFIMLSMSYYGNLTDALNDQKINGI